MVERLHQVLLISVFAGLMLLAGGSVLIAQSATNAPSEPVVFQLSKATVANIELGAEEPDQKLMLVQIRLSAEGMAVLKHLTAKNIGKGLLIEVPDGLQYGPNRIEKTLGGNKLGLVLPSDVARGLQGALE